MVGQRRRWWTVLMAVTVGAAVVTAIPVEAAAQGAAAMRSQGRAIQRALTKNAERIFKPRLVITQGSTGPVTAVDLSDDEHYLVTAVGNNSVRIWDLYVGREIARLPGHTARITGIAVAHDGSRAATVSEDRTVRLWNMARIGDVQLLQGHAAAVSAVAFSADDQLVVTGAADGEIRIWKTATGALVKAFKAHDGRVNGLAHGGGAAAARLVSGGADGRVRSWDLAKGTRLADLAAGSPVHSVTIGRQGRTIAAGLGSGEVRLWDLASGADGGRLAGHSGAVTSVTLDEGRNMIVSGGSDRSVRVFDTARRAELRTLGRHDGAISFVALNKDGAFALSGSEDGFTKLWNLASGGEIITLISTETGWAVVDASGRYDGNQQALAGIDWQAEDETVNIDNFAEGYFEPALLPRAVQAGGGLSPVTSIPGQGVHYPPSVTIVSPEAGRADRSVSIEVAAEDRGGGGVADVRLYRNGKLVTDEAGDADVDREDRDGGGVRLVKRYEIDLDPGTNVIAATAVNEEKLESKPETLTLDTEGQAAAGNLHLVTVGINTYRNPKLNLEYARPDANAIKGFFDEAGRSAVPVAEQHQRLDGQATKENILATLRSLREVPTSDVVVIYMAGHGVSVGDDWYYIPHEIEVPDKPEKLAGYALSSGEIKAEMESLNANRTFLLLDTCHSGTAVSPLKDYRGMKALRLLARAVGTHVLAATDRNQFAVELEKLGHGVFTYTLLDALQGKADLGPRDGRVTAREVIRYVEDKVPALSREYADYGQYPTGYSRGVDFPVALRR